MPFVDWVNKNQAKEVTRAVPVHLLKQEAVYGDSDDNPPDNLLIQGDNLLALKALLPVYAGRVKCIYIDPPYNTQSAFEHYDDKLEHSQWLSMMYPRLVLLRELLAESGSIWVQLDDAEAHYAKVLLDEIFSRKNFIADVSWQKSYAVRSNAEFFSTSVEHVLIYCRNRATFLPNKLPRSSEQHARFSNPDNDPRGNWQSITFSISLVSGARGRQFAKTGQSDNIYEVESPSGKRFMPPPRRCWARTKPVFEQLNRDNRIWWGRNGDSPPRAKMFLCDADDGVIPTTLWAGGEDFGFNQDGVRELRALGLDFSTPKPEKLLHTVLGIATDLDDLVLDSFAGSGTTAAVAHKMGRRYIGIEMGDHARTHCLPRLQKVVDGEQGGISELVGWRGGGGFRFCTLGQAAFDADGRINPDVRFATLASFIWHYETATPGAKTFNKPLLGRHNSTAYFLLYNGILGDKRPQGGNVLTHAILETLKERYPHDGPKVIYGETTRLGEAKLLAEGVTFRQIPYDIKTR
jgi:adenine-specific DNA-methyltransferase